MFIITTHNIRFAGQCNMMTTRITILLLSIWCFFELHVEIGAQKLSKEEDLELEKEFNLLNKPAVTTIETIHGEKYNCVDFYKQPAFDHPALKNHNFHYKMRPNSYPKEEEEEEDQRTYKNSSTANRSKNIWINNKGCPVGTVPIRKTTKQDLLNAKLASKIYGDQYKPLTQQEPGTHYAILHTNYGTGKEFIGGGMEASVYNPQPVVGTQYTSTQVKVANGPESIEVGWTVNPSLYKDSQTRHFIYTNVGAKRCFNLYCSAFVVLGSYPIDPPIAPISERNKKKYVKRFLIYRDSPSGHWWLVLNPERFRVGFWPSSIFTTLKNVATYIEWGGKAYSPPGLPSPPMGAGAKVLEEQTLSDAFCSRIGTVNESFVIVKATETSAYADIKEYQVIDEGFYDRPYGHLIYFGGFGNYSGI